MNYAAILAGGKGLSMHKMDVPKQFMILGSKPIFIHTIEQFLLNGNIDKIIVAAPKDWEIYTIDLLDKQFTENHDISVIKGGKNKNLSIMEAVKYIDEKWGIRKEDILINHDAIRPFVTQRISNDNIQKAAKTGACISAISTIDTIIDSKTGDTVRNIPPKRYMYQEQSPQTFKLSLLKELYNKIEEHQLDAETDTVRLVSENGYRVEIVKGDYSNIKIVTPYDLQIAEALLRSHISNNDKREVDANAK